MGEMKEQWEDQILVAEIALTLSVVDVPIRFVRRMRK